MSNPKELIFFPQILSTHASRTIIFNKYYSGGSMGGARGAHPSPLNFRPNWGLKGRKKIFFRPPPRPPPLLISRSGSGTVLFQQYFLQWDDKLPTCTMIYHVFAALRRWWAGRLGCITVWTQRFSLDDSRWPYTQTCIPCKISPWSSKELHGMQIEFHGVSTEFYRLLWSAHPCGAHRVPWKYTIIIQ